MRFQERTALPTLADAGIDRKLSSSRKAHHRSAAKPLAMTSTKQLDGLDADQGNHI